MGRLTRWMVPVVASVALAGVSCSDDVTTTTPSNTNTTPIVTTFTGVLAPGSLSGQTLNFAVGGSGLVTAVLTSLAPDPPAFVGMSLGIASGSSCQVVISNDAAIPGVSVVGQANAAGVLCVRIYDVGTVTAPLNFEIQVTHP